MFQRIILPLTFCALLVSSAAADNSIVVSEPAIPGADDVEPAPVTAPEGCGTAIQPVEFAPQPVFMSADCTADCWNGTQVTCTGSSCTADDSSCSSERGSCWGSTSGTKYCPQCCASSTPCSVYEGRACSSGSVPCLEGNICASCFCAGGTLECP